MKRLKDFIINVYDVAGMEWNFIRKDKPLLVILIGAMILYSLIYSFIYAPEVYNEVKIAVVDNDNTARSRKMIRDLDASPFVKVEQRLPSLLEAKNQFMARNVAGAIVIPEGFERNIEKGVKATFGVYADVSYFLSYKQTFFGAIEAMLEQNRQIEPKLFEMAGKDDVQAKFLSEPVQLKTSFLFNRYQGYATFAIPCVLILIIQQTLLIGIGMFAGVWEERKLTSRNYVRNGKSRFNPIEVIFGKLTVYIIIELVLLCYILFVEYKLFGFPDNGVLIEIFALFIPYVIASVMLGIAISVLFSYRETAIITYFALSLPLLIMTGITWTEQAMPDWILGFTKLMPSTSGVNAFVRMQTMGASLCDVSSDYWRLWILSAIFFVAAILSTYLILKRAERYSIEPNNKN